MSETTEIRDVSEKMQTAFEEMKKTLETQNDEVGKKLAESIFEEKMEKIHADLDKQEAAWNEKFADLEAKNNAPELATTSVEEESDADIQKSAFDSYLRKGIQGMDDGLKEKALIASNDTTGGYLAPAEFVQDMLSTVTEFSPIREVANVRSTSARTSKFPTRPGSFSAQWIGETGTRSPTTGLTFGMIEVPNHELYALVDVSNQDLEDTVFDLDSLLREQFAEQFGVAEGTAFVSGDGIAKPTGLTVGTGLGTFGSVTLDGGENITGDSIIETVYTLKSEYEPNASWLLNRTTVRIIRQLTVGGASDAQYLWQPAFGDGIRTGSPTTIMNHPYREATDFTAANTGALPAEGSVLAMFGDFRRGYGISDRIPLTVVRDDLTQAAEGNVRFLARRRVGGQVMVAESMVKLIKGASS
jgi:HK97 family phage major capsid protein